VVRISELSRATDVSLASIKYYLREGLLQPGSATAPNQAEYGPEHIHRLRLIRTLRDVGALSIERVRRILAAIDDPGQRRHDLFGVATRALEPDVTAEPLPAEEAARGEVDAFVAALGWEVRPEAATRHELAQVLVALRRLGREAEADVFGPYADVAERLAAWEVSTIDPSEPPSVAVERMVVGTVLFERALVALRRMAHEHQSARALDDATPGAGSEARP
jgi:DNA-binding transcriptional MerR regulator